jgi:chemotaxis protein MotB
VAFQNTRFGMNPKHLGTPLALTVALMTGVASAQETAPAAPSFDEVQATIKRMQERLNRLGDAAAERDQALRFLEQQVEQASGEIAGTGKTNESLRGEAAALSSQVEDLSRRRDELQGEVGERGAALEGLQSQVAELSAELGQAKASGTALARELEAAHASLAAATAREGDLIARIAALEATADSTAKASAARIAAAEAAAAEQAAAIAQLRQQLDSLRRTVGENTKAAADRIAESERLVGDLRRERDELKTEVDNLNRLLASAETKIDAQRDEIDGLDERLTAALEEKVEELEQYRSQFFGELRRALGDRPDLRVVGDRFVFQSELLFASGSARLDPAGQAQLRQLAATLQDVASRIPPGLDWVLRVDGHTDRQPIRDRSFRSNWELSVARAISVIEFLIAQGIPPTHLAAAGFGEYRPIDPTDDEVAYRRNRRIEFKLTEG